MTYPRSYKTSRRKKQHVKSGQFEKDNRQNALSVVGLENEKKGDGDFERIIKEKMNTILNSEFSINDIGAHKLTQIYGQELR